MSPDDFYAAAPGPKRRPRSAMAERSRELIAERTGWPDGALAACIQLERALPGFHVAWFPQWKTAATDFDREAGFYAWVAGEEPLHNGRQREEWYGATPEELKAKLGG